ncbi:MAG: type IV pilin N-terminal domain-containing protein [Lachnospiraceae bacterium]|nr:type IV pilin N-terminal domain-containing protein [Lachnospiraceae bacterium]
MNKDCSISSVIAVLLLIAITVLAAGILTAAVLSSDIFSPADRDISAVLTVSGDTGYLVFPEDRGIEQIFLHSPEGEYMFSGIPPVMIPEHLLISPASISAEFGNGKEILLMRI